MGKFGEYEWWYFDAKLSGGYSLVIIFYSQPVTAATLVFAPCVSFSLTGNGYEMPEEVTVPLSECHFSKEGCDIEIGSNSFKGDLKNYRIHFENERVNCDVVLEGLAESYRHHTGEIFFGEKKYFAWMRMCRLKYRKRAADQLPFFYISLYWAVSVSRR